MKMPLKYLNKPQLNAVNRYMKSLEEKMKEWGNHQEIDNIKLMGHPETADVYIRYDYVREGAENVETGRKYVCIDRQGNEVPCDFDDLQDAVHFHREMFEIEY